MADDKHNTINNIYCSACLLLSYRNCKARKESKVRKLIERASKQASNKQQQHGAGMGSRRGEGEHGKGRLWEMLEGE